MLPMQKITTLLNKTVFNPKKNVAIATGMQPSEATLKTILQFAATYRVEKIGKNQFVEMYLN
jgi:hypothetical protein